MSKNRLLIMFGLILKKDYFCGGSNVLVKQNVLAKHLKETKKANEEENTYATIVVGKYLGIVLTITQFILLLVSFFIVKDTEAFEPDPLPDNPDNMKTVYISNRDEFGLFSMIGLLVCNCICFVQDSLFKITFKTMFMLFTIFLDVLFAVFIILGMNFNIPQLLLFTGAKLETNLTKPIIYFFIIIPLVLAIKRIAFHFFFTSDKRIEEENENTKLIS